MVTLRVVIFRKENPSLINVIKTTDSKEIAQGLVRRIRLGPDLSRAVFVCFVIIFALIVANFKPWLEVIRKTVN